MARTKASVGAKISSGKSSKARCTVAPSTSGGGSGGADKSSRSQGGGNPVCPRETPKWQRPITNFFNGNKDTSGSDDGAGSSDLQPVHKKKRNIIESDEEEEKSENEDRIAENAQNGDLIAQNGEMSPEKGEVTPENGKVTPENDEVTPEKGDASVSPKVNRILDDTIELEDLKGEGSHKIEEYYNKGKGKGKKSTKNKENTDSNKRDSLKRDFEGDEERVSKRVKVDC